MYYERKDKFKMFTKTKLSLFKTKQQLSKWTNFHVESVMVPLNQYWFDFMSIGHFYVLKRVDLAVHQAVAANATNISPHVQHPQGIIELS